MYDKLCPFPAVVSDQEELERIYDECQMADHVCNDLNTYNRVGNSGAVILQGQAAHENMGLIGRGI